MGFRTVESLKGKRTLAIAWNVICLHPLPRRGSGEETLSRNRGLKMWFLSVVFQWKANKPKNPSCGKWIANCWSHVKVARYSFSRSIHTKFERKLRRYEQRFGKIDTTVVLDKDENLLWSGLQWHRSCHSNEMTPLPILLATVFLGTGNCSSKIVYWSFFPQ